MDIKHRLERSFKPRFAVIYPFGFLMLIIGYSNTESIRAGIGWVIAGLLIRLWSNGYAIKNDKLTTSGPYAFVRNPLYLGTLLIALGFAIILNTSWLGVLFLIALIVVYYQTIQSEQGMLTEKFGDSYKHYMSKVHAILPTLNPYADGAKWPFSLQRLIDSKEHKTFFWIIIILIFFHLKSRLLIDHQDMTPKLWALTGTAAALILLDIFYELNKTKIHQK